MSGPTLPTVPPPNDVLVQLRQGTERLLSTADRYDTAGVRRPSLLTGWTVGHVLTHLARNADSHVRRLQAALEGRVVAQYEGGWPARNAAIAEGARRSATEILDDLRTSCERLDELLVGFPESVWDSALVEREHFTAPAATLPITRVIEVEIHHVDLDADYGPSHWPEVFVDEALARTVERIGIRHSGVAGAPASWHLHRSDGEGEWLLRRTAAGSTLEAGHLKGDCALRGPGSALLIFLLGRYDPERAGVEVLGDRSLAGELPVLYPYG